MSWRVRKMCENCPFRTDEAAYVLAPGRLDGIKDAAIVGRPFHCHKTVYTASLRKHPRRLWLECAGALAYRARVWRIDRDAVPAALRRIMARAS